jgi:hypothetical protein
MSALISSIDKTLRAYPGGIPGGRDPGNPGGIPGGRPGMPGGNPGGGRAYAMGRAAIAGAPV